MTTFGKLWASLDEKFLVLELLSRNIKRCMCIGHQMAVLLYDLQSECTGVYHEKRQIRVCLSWPVKAVRAMSGDQLLESSFSENVAF